ncbi:MAG: hypothetical protein DRJ38_00135 [Thermoprotei archaeon]|nr:MAG: hypothetical protein DRJ38_00135 [Thermoprotei archaeon]
MRIQVVAPEFDVVTSYSVRWAEEAIEKLREKYVVRAMTGRPYTRQEVERVFERAFEMFVFYDHGNEDALYGDENEKVIDLDNVELLRDKIVYTMACLSAKKLGVEAWRRGCRVYWGYYEPFCFTLAEEHYFKRFANYGLMLLADGVPPAEAKRRTLQLGQQLIEELQKRGRYIAAAVLKQDMEALRCYNGEIPPSTCPFRRLALLLFGRHGWHLRKLLRSLLRRLLPFL